MKWTVWTLLSRCTVASFLAIPSVRTEASKQTEAQSPIREFRDAAGRLFRLNLNTGATEWDSNDPTHLKAQGQEPAREGPPRVTVQAGLKEDKADVMEKRTDLFNPQIAGSNKDTQPHASAAVPPRGVTPLQDMPPSRPARMPSASRATKTFSEVVTSGSHPTSGRSQRSKFGFGRGRGLDDWLGWGETADPIAEEVREDLATDLRPSPWQSPGFPQGIPKLGAQSLEAKRHQKADFKHVQKDAGTTAKKLSTEAAHFGRSRSERVHPSELSKVKSASRVRDLAWARAQKLRGRETKPSSEPLVRPGAVRSADGDVNAKDQELLKKGKDLLAKLERQGLDAALLRQAGITG